MGGRNNKLCDQRVKTQKGSGRQRNPPKEILPWVKRTISNVYGRQKKQLNLNDQNNKTINKLYRKLFYKEHSLYVLTFFPVDKSCQHYFYKNMNNI